MGSVRKSSLASTTTFVFFAPPTMEVLEQRLRGRGTETEEKVQKRLKGAFKEMEIHDSKPDAWDVTLKWTNDVVDKAYEEFREFLKPQIPTTRSKCVVTTTTFYGPTFY